MKDNTTRQDKRGRILRTAEQRQELVDRYKASGLGMTVFCQREDVTLSTFCHWYNQGFRGARHRPGARLKKAPMKFTEVKMALGGAAPIEVELPGGTRIRIRNGEAWPVVGRWLREVAGC